MHYRVKGVFSQHSKVFLLASVVLLLAQLLFCLSLDTAFQPSQHVDA